MNHRWFGIALLACALCLLFVGCHLLSSPVAAPTPASDPARLLTPPVPGVAFPRQEPVEGERAYMTAALWGVLELEEGCLWVRSLDGASRVLPIWPPEFSLVQQQGRLSVTNESLAVSGDGADAERIVVAVGEEVFMAGGHAPQVSDWTLSQVPDACRGDYFIVGQPESVRPNLREQSELFTWERIVEGLRTALILRHTPAFVAQAGEPQSLSGELVLYEGQRCLQLQTGRGPGPITLLWPQAWAVSLSEGAAEVLDGAGHPVGRTGERVTLRARPIPQDWESEVYRRAVQELPGDCCCSFWLVEASE